MYHRTFNCLSVKCRENLLINVYMRIFSPKLWKKDPLLSWWFHFHSVDRKDIIAIIFFLISVIPTHLLSAHPVKTNGSQVRCYAYIKTGHWVLSCLFVFFIFHFALPKIGSGENIYHILLMVWHFKRKLELSSWLSSALERLGESILHKRALAGAPTTSFFGGFKPTFNYFPL